MGKNGKAMRERKAQVTYSYTAAQLAEMKKQAVMEAKREIIEEADARLGISAITDSLALMLAIPVTVLCRDFGWKPIGEKHDGRSRLSRFIDAVIGEADKVLYSQDIKGYCDQCGELYGVKFKSEVDDGETNP